MIGKEEIFKVQFCGKNLAVSSSVVPETSSPSIRLPPFPVVSLSDVGVVTVTSHVVAEPSAAIPVMVAVPSVIPVTDSKPVASHTSLDPLSVASFFADFGKIKP